MAVLWNLQCQYKRRYVYKDHLHFRSLLKEDSQRAHLSMYAISVIFVCIHLRLVFSAFSVKSTLMLAHQSIAGVGDVVSEEHDVSALGCAMACVVHDECTSANYSPTNHTCTLLHVHDTLDDWQDSQNIVYISDNQPQDFTGETIQQYIGIVALYL